MICEFKACARCPGAAVGAGQIGDLYKYRQLEFSPMSSRICTFSAAELAAGPLALHSGPAAFGIYWRRRHNGRGSEEGAWETMTTYALGCKAAGTEEAVLETQLSLTLSLKTAAS